MPFFEMLTKHWRSKVIWKKKPLTGVLTSFNVLLRTPQSHVTLLPGSVLMLLLSYPSTIRVDVRMTFVWLLLLIWLFGIICAYVYSFYVHRHTLFQFPIIDMSGSMNVSIMFEPLIPTAWWCSILYFILQFMLSINYRFSYIGKCFDLHNIR